MRFNGRSCILRARLRDNCTDARQPGVQFYLSSIAATFLELLPHFEGGGEIYLSLICFFVSVDSRNASIHPVARETRTTRIHLAVDRDLIFPFLPIALPPFAFAEEEKHLFAKWLARSKRPGKHFWPRKKNHAHTPGGNKHIEFIALSAAREKIFSFNARIARHVPF